MSFFCLNGNLQSSERAYMVICRIWRIFGGILHSHGIELCTSTVHHQVDGENHESPAVYSSQCMPASWIITLSTLHTMTDEEPLPGGLSCLCTSLCVDQEVFDCMKGEPDMSKPQK